MSEPAPAVPSATVLVLRDGDRGLEVLMLRRHQDIVFHGGAWVFPGGRTDVADREGAADELAAARVAAAREAHEEADLVLAADAFVPWARWVTPQALPKRFDTWFFLAAMQSDQAVQVDGGEIVEHRWLRPGDALRRQHGGELALPPPTFVTLVQLLPHRDVTSLLAATEARLPPAFEPRPQACPGGFVSVYREDAGYESGDLDRDGPRHRLWAVDSGWRYEDSWRPR